MDNLAQSQTVIGSNLIISCFGRSQVIYIISLNCCNALLQNRNIFCLEVLSYTLFIIFFNFLEEVSGSIGNLLQSFNAYTYNVYELFKVCFIFAPGYFLNLIKGLPVDQRLVGIFNDEPLLLWLLVLSPVFVE